MHVTVSSAFQTVCGHLMAGCYTARDEKGDMHAVSHFTIAIAKVSGVILKATWDKTGHYHELVPA